MTKPIRTTGKPRKPRYHRQRLALTQITYLLPSNELKGLEGWVEIWFEPQTGKLCSSVFVGKGNKGAYNRLKINLRTLATVAFENLSVEKDIQKPMK